MATIEETLNNPNITEESENESESVSEPEQTKSGKKSGRKEPFGRPTEYRDSYVGEVDKFLKEVRMKYVLLETEVKKGKEIKLEKKTKTFMVSLPSRYKFAQRLDCDEETLIEWGKRHPDFSVALNKIDQAQKEMLLDGTASGLIKEGIAKLILINNHGFKNKLEVETRDLTDELSESND